MDGDDMVIDRASCCGRAAGKVGVGQERHHLLHAGPLLRILLQAHLDEVDEDAQVCGVVVPAQALVEHLVRDERVVDVPGGPKGQQVEVLDGRLARDELQQHDAVAVDVALEGVDPGAHVLGVQVAQGALDVGVHGDEGGGVGGRGLGQAEVGELGGVGVGEEDVSGLDVPVADGGAGAVVQVLQRGGELVGDGHAGGPRQRRGAGVVEAVVEAALRRNSNPPLNTVSSVVVVAVFNGGFERSTLLDRWPAWQNCSSGDQAEEKCVKTVWFPGELFSLCSWSVGGGGGVAAPDWMRAPAAAPPGWTAARGAAALLLRANAAVAQAVPTRPGGRYRLSLAVLVGYLARLDAHGDGGGWAFAECARPAGGGYVAVQLGDGATPVLLGATTDGGEEDGQDGAATACTRWVERRVGFTAVGEVTVVVVGGSGFGACGPVVDDVRVEEVGEDGAGGAGDDRDGVAGGGGGGGRNRTVVVVACTVAAAAVVVAATAAGVVGGPRLRRQWRRRGREETAAAVMREVAGGGDAAQAAAAAGHRVKAYSYAELGKATAGWTTFVARGGLSTVYRAELPDGTVAAVKVEKSAAEDDDDAAAKDAGPPHHEQDEEDQEEEEQHSNRAELWVLLRVNHRFLVSVTGICHDRPTAALVLEYLPNGTLHQRLHHLDKEDTDDDSGPRHGPLSWPARMKIIYQVTCALEHLHHGASPPTVHRDVKSANILLTATDSAKLADFGLSRAVTTVTAAPPDTRPRRGGEVKGSLGYLDPTYLRTGAYSLKSAVYSYGVLLLETVSGHTAIKDGDLLAAWAAPFMHAAPDGDGDLVGIVDPRVPPGDVAHADLRTLLLLARACVQDEPARRPGMDRALATLTEARFPGCPPASPVAVPHAILAGFSGLASDDQLTSRGSTSVGSGSLYTPSSVSSGSVF